MSPPHVDIRIPGRVYYDALDPNTSGMLKELNLTPHVHRRGKGVTVRFYSVPLETGYELGEYLQDRAQALLSQFHVSDQDRELSRTMGRTGAAIVSNCKLHEGRAR